MYTTNTSRFESGLIVGKCEIPNLSNNNNNNNNNRLFSSFFYNFTSDENFNIVNLLYENRNDYKAMLAHPSWGLIILLGK